MEYKSVNDLAFKYMKDMFTYVWNSYICTTRFPLRMIYNITNCTFKDFPAMVLRYGTPSVVTFTIVLMWLYPF